MRRITLALVVLAMLLLLVAPAGARPIEPPVVMRPNGVAMIGWDVLADPGVTHETLAGVCHQLRAELRLSDTVPSLYPVLEPL